MPKYAHSTDAGFDIYAPRKFSIKASEVLVVGFDVASEIPAGFYVHVFDKSSVAARGVHTLAGVIDSGYRGEWKIVLVNLSGKRQVFDKGDKVAQGVLLPVSQAEIVKVKNLPTSDRGPRGFGSTGKK